MAGDELLKIPDIPVEIVRIILETLAIMSRPDALRLVLVCKAIRKWIDVILYHSVTIVSSSQAPAFLRAIQSRTEAGDTSFFADTVKYLFFKLDLPPLEDRDRYPALVERNASAKALVSACSGLVALGLEDELRSAPFIEVVFGSSPGLPSRLKRLSLTFWGGNNTLKHLPPTLTHLHYPLGSLPLGLLRTAPLTHLSVSILVIPFADQTVTPFVDSLMEVVEAMPDTVKMCVFAYDGGDNSLPMDPKDIRDPRVAILGLTEEDWERHGWSRKLLSQDCGFLPEGHLDTWEFYAKLVKEGRSECRRES